MRFLRRLVKLLLVLAALYVAVLAFPQPNFNHRMTYGQYEVLSDRPIPPQIRQVLDDVTRSLERSELYSPGERFRIFFCNEDWRMALYSQHFSSAPGGVADGWLTRNVYIRRSDIAANRLFAPQGRLADAEARPLSYFIAHELAHVLQSRAFGRFMALRHPRWLREGYADYVGKGGAFDLEANRRLLIAGDPALDPGRSGLHRGYHLLVAWLVDRDGRSIRDVYRDPPGEAALLARVRSAPPPAEE
jgi:hypothetical protein